VVFFCLGHKLQGAFGQSSVRSVEGGWLHEVGVERGAPGAVSPGKGVSIPPKVVIIRYVELPFSFFKLWGVLRVLIWMSITADGLSRRCL
jgi:hypothetical protein